MEIVESTGGSGRNWSGLRGQGKKECRERKPGTGLSRKGKEEEGDGTARKEKAQRQEIDWDGAHLLPRPTSGKFLSHSVPRFPYLSTRLLRMLTSWVK